MAMARTSWCWHTGQHQLGGIKNAAPTHLQPPVEGFWYGDTGGLSRAVRRDRRDEGVQLVPGETRETYLFISADFNFRDLSPLRAKCNLTKFTSMPGPKQSANLDLKGCVIPASGRPPAPTM